MTNALSETSWPSSGLVLPGAAGLPLGRTQPRIWTPPLRELTPETSYGFDAVEFNRRMLRHPLDPWQEWAAIHGGELLDDGRPRFRIVIILVGRQAGKTELLVGLSSYWQFVEAWPMILGTSTKLDYAKESWVKARKLATKSRALRRLRGPRRWYRMSNGEMESWTTEGSRYKIAASNEEGGRSLTVNRAILDELRQHHDYSAWNAIEPACSPPDAQIWCLSNAGSDRSVVLNEQREAALKFIRTGVGDPRVGLFEWSAPEDADAEDVEALAQANPNVGRRTPDWDALLGAARRAKAAGGEQLTGFRTEQMCIRVKLLNPAIDPAAWNDCRDPGTLDGVRDRVALCFDVAPDMQHASLCAAAVLPDGRVRVEVVAAWEGPTAPDQARRRLPVLVGQVKPRVLGWLPGGPGAALAADLKERRGWPPRGVQIEEIRGDLPAVAMGFVEQVTSAQVAHSGDPLLDAQVGSAERLRRGDVWVFSRRGDAHVDALYGAAGAAHLARTLPPPPERPLVVVPRSAR